MVTVRIHTWGQPVDDSQTEGLQASIVPLGQGWGQPGDLIGTSALCPGDNWGYFPSIHLDRTSPQLYPQGLVDGDTRSHLPQRSLSTSSTGAMTTTNYLLNVAMNPESGRYELWTEPFRTVSRLILSGFTAVASCPDSPSGQLPVSPPRYRHADRVAFNVTREVTRQEARP